MNLPTSCAMPLVPCAGTASAAVLGAGGIPINITRRESLGQDGPSL